MDVSSTTEAQAYKPPQEQSPPGSVPKKSRRPVIKLCIGEESLLSASTFCTEYSERKVRPAGLKLVIDRGDGPPFTERNGALIFKRTELIEWMNQWEYYPPAGIDRASPGPVDLLDQVPWLAMHLSPRFFVKERHANDNQQQVSDETQSS